MTGVDMRFELVDPHVVPTSRSTVCRVQAMGSRWRVVVESWPVRGGWGGRVVFDPDVPGTHHDRRTTAPSLFGRTQGELLSLAHTIPERRLLQLLHSFG